MRELEKKIEDRIVKWARKHKIKVKIKYRGEILDRWFFFPEGKLFIIEVKRPDEETFPRQQLEIDELRSLGYDVEVHDNSDEAIEALKRRMATPQVSEKCRKILATKRRRRIVP